MRNIDILKESIKKLAREIRGTRYQFRESQRNRKTNHKLLRQLETLRYEFRHHHIAYCELRGRTRDQIETKPQSTRKQVKHTNENYINKIKEAYAWTPEEITTYEERMAKKNETIHS